MFPGWYPKFSKNILTRFSSSKLTNVSGEFTSNIIFNNYSFWIGVFHNTALDGNNYWAWITGDFEFHPGTYKRGPGDQERYSLTLHIRNPLRLYSHHRAPGTVSMPRQPIHLCRGDIHIMDLTRQDNRKSSSKAALTLSSVNLPAHRLHVCLGDE